MLVITVFIVYSFFIAFYPFFSIAEAARVASTDSKPFRKISLISRLRWITSETKYNLNRLHVFFL